MSTQLQLRRGTTAQHSTFTGASGEITIDTDKKTVVVHDGTTPGGRALSTFDPSGRNRIINGAMMIDQRNAGESVTASNGSFGVDRFKTAVAGTGVFTMQRSSTAPTGFANSQLLTVTTADTSIVAIDEYSFRHYIEGYNFADLMWGTSSAQAITLSFWVRSSITGTYAVGLRNKNADRTYPATYTINSANTWEYKTITVAGDTTGTWEGATNQTGVALIFSLGAGSGLQGTANTWNSGNLWSTATATQWISTVGATFYITGVQLEKGSVATPFEFRPYGTELALCQRYYEQANFPVAGVCSYAAGSWQSGGNFTVPYKTVKRGATSTTVSLAGNIDNCSSVSLTNDLYDSGFIINFTVANASYPYMRANILYKAGAEL